MDRRDRDPLTWLIVAVQNVIDPLPVPYMIEERVAKAGRSEFLEFQRLLLFGCQRFKQGMSEALLTLETRTKPINRSISAFATV